MPTNDWKRKDKRRKQFDLQAPPNQLSLEELDELGLAPDDPVRRAMTDMFTATQANFDHLTSETGRFARLFNENEADTAWAKDRLFSHDHPPQGPLYDAARGEDLGVGTAYHQSYHAGTYIPDAYFSPGQDEIDAVPFYAGSNFHGSSINATLDSYDTTFGTSGTYNLRLGVYAGDGRGFNPGALIQDAGITGDITNGSPAAPHVFSLPIDIDFREGEWYWLVGHQEGGFDDLILSWDGYNSTEGLIFASPTTFWNPFPRLATGISEAYQTLSYTVGGATGWNSGEPFPEQLIWGAVIRSNIAPLIEIGVE